MNEELYLPKTELTELREDASNSSQSSERTSMKLFVSITILSLICFFNNVSFDFFVKEPDCINDTLFNFTTGVRSYLSSNKQFKNIIMITAGVFEDVSVVLGFLFFAFYFKSWRMGFSLVFCYSIRMCIQQIYLMKIPDDSLFEYPGFPSLVVPYYSTSDYFFSGHVSLPIIIAHEFWVDGGKYRFIAYFEYLTAIFEAVMMIFVRGHYSIDLYAGIIFSLLSCKITDLYIGYIDASKIGMNYAEHSTAYKEIPQQEKE